MQAGRWLLKPTGRRSPGDRAPRAPGDRTGSNQDTLRALITGFGGFVGPHLAAELRSEGGSELWGTVYQEAGPTPPQMAADPACRTVPVDLRDGAAVRALLLDLRPDHIYHLAAQSSVAASWQDPWSTLESNVRMQLNLLEAARDLRQAGAGPAGGPRIVVASTNEVYGAAATPTDERAPVDPRNPYAVSKVAQDLLAAQCAQAWDLDLVRVRPFSHIGPGQDDRFVAAAFARQVAEIEAGLREPIVRVGDLSARRDFSDVRDIVRGYRLAAEHGRSGRVYNLGQGRAVPIAAILEHFTARSRRPLRVEQDPARLRPAEVALTLCDAGRAEAELGWRPTIPLERTLDEVLDDWRSRVTAAQAAPGHPERTT